MMPSSHLRAAGREVGLAVGSRGSGFAVVGFRGAGRLATGARGAGRTGTCVRGVGRLAAGWLVGNLPLRSAGALPNLFW